MNVSVLCLFLAVARIGLRSVIVAIPGHILICFLDSIWSPYVAWPRGYKSSFMLNSTEQEISTAHKN